MKKTALKYSILRIRQKISFMAFMKKMTIQELILQTIVKSHEKFEAEGQIPVMDPFLS